MAVPTLTQTGWYDQQVMSIKNFTGLKENAATELARSNQYLIVGPWTHDGTEWPTKLGVHGLRFEEAHLDYYDITAQWYRRWLYGEEDAIADWPRVRIFVMGDNTWRDEEDWPLARTRYVPYYLHSGGGAASVEGDGALSEDPPGEEPADEYVYDPRDPVMTLYQQRGQHEPLDQRALDDRRDILRFATPPFRQEVEVTGHIRLRLYAASTASVIRTLSPSSWTSGRTASLRSFAMESCGRDTGSRSRIPLSSSRGRSTSTTSRSIPRLTYSSVATAFGSTCRAATSQTSTATTTPAETTMPMQRLQPRDRPSFMTPRGLLTLYCL